MAAVVWLVIGVVVLPLLRVGFFGSAVRAGPVVVGAQLLIAFASFSAALVLIYRMFQSLDAEAQDEALAHRRSALAKLGVGVAVVASGGYAWRALLGGQAGAAAPGSS